MSQISLEVTQSEAREMLVYFKSRKSDIIKANEAIFIKLNELDGSIAKLEAILNSQGARYPIDGSWNQKIRYILNSYPDGLQTKQVVDAIMQVEHRNADERKNVYSGVAPSISAGVGVLYTRIEIEGEENKYTNLKK